MGQVQNTVERVATVDRRRTRGRAAHRRHIERLMALAEHLPAADRLLLRQVYEHGERIAHLAQQARRPARTLYAHIRRLVTRLQTRRFRFLAASGDLLPPDVLATARLVVAAGLPLRAAAAARSMSLHQVRMHMQTFDALARVG